MICSREDDSDYNDDLMCHFFLNFITIACLDVFNFSFHSVRMSCWIKRLLTY